MLQGATYSRAWGRSRPHRRAAHVALPLFLPLAPPAVGVSSVHVIVVSQVTRPTRRTADRRVAPLRAPCVLGLDVGQSVGFLFDDPLGDAIGAAVINLAASRDHADTSASNLPSIASNLRFCASLAAAQVAAQAASQTASQTAAQAASLAASLAASSSLSLALPFSHARFVLIAAHDLGSGSRPAFRSARNARTAHQQAYSCIFCVSSANSLCVLPCALSLSPPFGTIIPLFDTRYTLSP